MVMRIPEENFVIWFSSEGTNIGATDSKQTRGLCCHHDYRFFVSYDYLQEILKHLKIIKIKCHRGENVADCCVAILVDAEKLEIAGAFKPDHLGYITCIFEYNSDPRLHIWELISTIRLRSLFRNFVCVTRMPCGLSRSLPMGILFKRL